MSKILAMASTLGLSRGDLLKIARAAAGNGAIVSLEHLTTFERACLKHELRTIVRQEIEHRRIAEANEETDLVTAA